MLTNNLSFKRISAYMIDFIIVAFIATIFSDFAIINPYYEEYYDTYEEYYEFIDNSENVNDKEFLTKIENYTYDISKYGVYFTIISCITSFVYYTLCQYFSKGRTLGKALFKIKVVGKHNKAPSFIQILIRTFIINSILVYLLNIIFIFFLSKPLCLIGLSILEIVDYFVILISFIMILFKKEGRGIHDILSGTKVISEKCKQEY